MHTYLVERAERLDRAEACVYPEPALDCEVADA
jgi:hypothetical protein